ncbi:dTDP-4-dehydrorhamnose 3,5-epimerase [Tunicatimonas pelagia]|uniref:dTDP-4-dehydrorhamnose 3,5-epimerase n=1 Tax=Tunicatimonas pelagia TaxID=931531 RepID=UPI002664FEC9|nr:dTDP-4-dehydrorhamnose 3,5-epimerase [Tunicatimonas pelagia]WKN45220.1 dTDP-4-dehydrorhamnose 3,5-epimerase [Tunicatimonas pelagia]
MKIRKTSIEGLIEIIPDLYRDSRGFFLETFHIEKYREIGVDRQFVQSNQSFSTKGVLRGLHMQLPPYQQGKLVSVSKGKVLDVAVDLRKGSSTFGHYESVVLDSERCNQFYVPEGFAHGFVALEESVFSYQCTNVYDKASEAGIIWDDADLAIDWELEKYDIQEPIISDKDLALPRLSEYQKQYT